MLEQLSIEDHYKPENDVTVFQGSCLDLLASVPDKSMQLVVTSPPYNIGKEYEKHLRLEDYLEQQRAVIVECVRALRDEGHICWQVGNYVERSAIVPLDAMLYPLFHELSLKMRNRIVWHFEHGLHCKKRFSGRYETVMWFTKSDDYFFNLDPVRVPQKYPGKKHFKGPKAGEYSCNPLGKNPGDVWIIPNVKSNHVEKTIHPCQFPVELVERLVLSMTQPGDSVLDPFLGVGSTIVAAVIHERKGHGAEIIPEYIEVAKDRIRKAARGSLNSSSPSQARVRSEARWQGPDDCTMGQEDDCRDSRPLRLRLTGTCGMRILETYSHLNGEEYLLVHHPDLYDEVKATVSAVDASQFMTKISKEKTMRGKRLYSPRAINSEFARLFAAKGWKSVVYRYYITTNRAYLEQIVNLPIEDQKAFLQRQGIGEPMKSLKQTDYVKDQIAVEAQFGKYAFVAYDLFVKHLLFYSGGVINVGVEILPVKAMTSDPSGGRLMSTGIAYFEGEVYNVLRHGRNNPPVPLVIIGIGP